MIKKDFHSSVVPIKIKDIEIKVFLQKSSSSSSISSSSSKSLLLAFTILSRDINDDFYIIHSFRNAC